MSAFQIISDEDSRDLGSLARQIQWAELIVNAALPPGEDGDRRSDRATFRAIAFEGVLRAMTEHEYTARPAALEALMDGRMPPLEDPS
jgi:hypothetical protein